MIWNIVDGRKRQYRWRVIRVIVEPTWHDNGCNDSDQASAEMGELDIDEKMNISVEEALEWARGLPFPVTLYLYDANQDES